MSRTRYLVLFLPTSLLAARMSVPRNFYRISQINFMEKEMTTPIFDLRRYGHHAIFKAMGFTAEELSLPRIAVINSWSEQSPGHVHLKAVAEGVKAGIRMAGGMPFEINVPGLCSVPHKIPSDMLYDMPQREAVLAGAGSLGSGDEEEKSTMEATIPV